MIRISTVIVIAAAIAASSDVRAAELASVELVPPEKNEYWVGQRIGFVIDLLALGQFSGTPQFDLPRVSGVIVMKVAGRPTLSVRDVDGESYVVQRHEFVLFAARAGTCTLPPITVRFGSREQFDKPVTEHSVTTNPLEVEVKLPEGAPPGATVVSTSELTADEQWKPPPGPAKVGDAFTRTLTIKAVDVPGMLLPVLPYEPIDGLAGYPKQPLVRSSSERGDFTGERIESVTYVCGKPGDYEIPEFVIRWWNVEQEAWKEERFPSALLKVSPDPALAAQGNSEQALETSMPGGDAHVVLVLTWTLLAGLLLALPWLLKVSRARRERRLRSGAGLFAQLVKACHTGDVPAADRAMTQWLDGLELPRERFLEAATDDEILTAEFYRMQEALIGYDLPWDGHVLAQRLRHFRRIGHKNWPRDDVAAPLPPLNPVPGSKRSVL